MKKFVLLGIALMATVTLKAQFFSNFLDQHAAQRKNLEEQIAELEVYVKDLDKGYKIVESGINDMQSLKGGEFNLHSAFFGSLAAINPSVKGMAQVAEIALLQVFIVESFKNKLSSYQKSGRFSGSELTLLNEVYNNMTTACTDDLTQLAQVITAGSYTMTDDQRMQRINDLDTDMKDKYVLSNSITGNSDLLLLQRQHDQAEIGTVSALYGVTP